MANYPIKVLIDEKGQEFIPISSTGALLDPTGQNLDTILASKLETNSIMAGSGITLNKNTTNHTVEINCSLPGASVIDNLTTTVAGQGSLDAHQGHVLNTTKINISDIVNNVTSTDADKPLSAYQGYLLSNRIPNKVSDLTNDAGYAKTTDLLNLVYPIGSIYMSVNSTSPATFMGGQWELIDKHFKEWSFYSTDTEVIKEYVTPTDNAIPYAFGIIRSEHSVYMRYYYKNQVSIADSSVSIGTMLFEKFGILNALYFGIYDISAGSEDGIVLMNVSASTGEMYSSDVVIKGSSTSISSGASIRFEFEVRTPKEYMLDTHCDKFFWKRLS